MNRMDLQQTYTAVDLHVHVNLDDKIEDLITSTAVRTIFFSRASRASCDEQPPAAGRRRADASSRVSSVNNALKMPMKGPLLLASLAAALILATTPEHAAAKSHRRRRAPKPPPKPPPHPAGCSNSTGLRDCSGNGVCLISLSGQPQCTCDPGWTGPKCQTLHLVPGSAAATGLRQINVVPPRGNSSSAGVIAGVRRALPHRM